MKLLNSQPAVIAAAVIAAGVVLYFLSRQAAAAAGELAGDAAYALAPTNPDNIFSSGVNAVGDALSGGEPGGFSLGGAIYDLFNPTYDPNAAPATPDNDSLTPRSGIDER